MCEELQKILTDHKKFTQERDWDRFQSPKNLAMALSVEVAELVETLMWLTEKQASCLNEKQKTAAADEIADVFTYLLRLADVLGVDLIAAAEKKMKKNRKKYPVEKGRALAKNFSKSDRQ